MYVWGLSFWKKKKVGGDKNLTVMKDSMER